MRQSIEQMVTMDEHARCKNMTAILARRHAEAIIECTAPRIATMVMGDTPWSGAGMGRWAAATAHRARGWYRRLVVDYRVPIVARRGTHGRIVMRYGTRAIEAARAYDLELAGAASARDRETVRMGWEIAGRADDRAMRDYIHGVHMDTVEAIGRERWGAEPRVES